MANTQDQLEIDAIDAMLGEPEPRRKPRMERAIESPPRIESPLPRVNEPPSDLDMRTSSLEPTLGTDAFTREPSQEPALGTEPVLPRPGAQQPTEPERVAVSGNHGTPPAAPPIAPSISAPASTSSRGAPSANFQEAYGNFTGMVSPNASQGDMEAAIERAFGSVPGYEGAYKESVKINGKWWDLVSGYGGANASFQMLPKTGEKGAFGAFGDALFPGGPSLPEVDDTSRLDQILASIDAMARGEGSPLVSQSIDDLLGAVGGGRSTGAQGATPMVDQTPFMAQQVARRGTARTRVP